MRGREKTILWGKGKEGGDKEMKEGGRKGRQERDEEGSETNKERIWRKKKIRKRDNEERNEER